MPGKLVGMMGAALLIPALLNAQTTAGRTPAPTGAARAAAAPTRYILAAGGNEARYLVREQLAGIDFPSDAVGRTSAITGTIVLDARGSLVAAESRFSIDVTTLKSDRANRDRYLKTAALETNKYPTVDLAITGLRGFPAVLPATGPVTFDLVGNLTVRAVTKPVTWHVTATVNNGEWTGTASTAFKFGDFGMPVPSAFVMMKLEDNLRLEYDFHFVKDTTAKP